MIKLTNKPKELYNQQDADYTLQAVGADLRSLNSAFTPKGVNLERVAEQRMYLPELIEALQRVVDYHKSNNI